MLTSLSKNGEVDEATILVAAFDLNAKEKAALRLGAGRMKRRMRFIDCHTLHVAGCGFCKRWRPIRRLLSASSC